MGTVVFCGSQLVPDLFNYVQLYLYIAVLQLRDR